MDKIGRAFWIVKKIVNVGIKRHRTRIPNLGTAPRARYTRTMFDKNDVQGVNADFARRVRDSFERQGLMKHLGARMVTLQPGQVEIRVAYRSELTQQHNYFHAGVSGSIGDTACGYAAYTLMPADSSVLTVEYKINLIAPADGEELIARAHVIRSGKTLKICMADVHVRRGETEIHCATMLATIMCLPGKSDRAAGA